jgi:hypothetical protein
LSTCKCAVSYSVVIANMEGLEERPRTKESANRYGVPEIRSYSQNRRKAPVWWIASSDEGCVDQYRVGLTSL